MADLHNAAQQASPAYLARRSLQVSAVLALLGTLANIPFIIQGQMRGGSEYLVIASLCVEVLLLMLLFLFPRIPLEPLAVAATVYFGVYLSAACLVSVHDRSQTFQFALFFLWFAPLLVFNWLVNRLDLARWIGKLLLVGPLLIVAVSWPHLKPVLPESTLLLLVNLVLSHLMLGTMLAPLTRFRAAYTLERALVASMQAEADLVERTAFYDSLTGLPNRAAVKRQLTALLSGTGGETGLIVIDLDHFQTLNDALGHAVGDLLLQRVTERLQGARRAGETVAHLGADTFACVLEGLPAEAETAERELALVCARFSEVFTEVFQLGEHECQSTCSLGVSLSYPGATAETMLKRADLALLHAKTQGRNCCSQFALHMEEHAAARATMARDLRRALTHAEFSLVYQPQVDASGALLGAEALIRWRRTGGALVPPCDFIPLAEEAGLIVPIGRWVLEAACTQLAAWSTVPGMERLTMSVNVSVEQLMDPSFVDVVEEVLTRCALRGDRLKLEITESALMQRVEEGIARMTDLRRKGVRFSLDDFGTGHSSLAYLKRLPLDQLKIDRGFVSGVHAGGTDASIARTIILLAQSLCIEVIAEGVETEEQRSFLASEGCLRYQGYYFSRPLTAAQFEDFAEGAAAARGPTERTRDVSGQGGVAVAI